MTALESAIFRIRGLLRYSNSRNGKKGGPNCESKLAQVKAWHSLECTDARAYNINSF